MPAIEPAILAQLFAMGGETLRVALCAQLRADFTRLHDAVAAADANVASRATHEVKGLAGTVGALRLADMARRLDSMGSDLAADVRDVLVAGMRAEIKLVLQALQTAGDSYCA
jgi:HPt (histidine-containing phosphotransfer) domain-containing protein